MSYAECIIKPIKRDKKRSLKKTLLLTMEKIEIYALIIQLVKLLKKEDWSAKKSNCNIDEENSIKILETKLYTKANTFDQS